MCSSDLDQPTIDKLRKICDATDQIKDYGARWVLKNWEFHRALYVRAESPTIVEAVERIQLNTERYARRTGSPERLRQAAAEHRQILSALERRDFAKASARLERHILNTGEAIRREHEAQAPGEARQACRKGRAAGQMTAGRSRRGGPLRPRGCRLSPRNARSA